MAKNRQYKNWQIVLASTLVVGVTLTYSATHSFAQNITLDGTLGTAETLTGPNYQIPESWGKSVGNNLFHSFGKFNLNADEAAIFESSNNIRNILSRVTGGTASSIDGLIRTLSSDVNFFLINPSGIIFGQNARLDVSGSFVASTANAIQFGNQGFFSATNPEPPSQLLTINPSALFFNQLQAGTIDHQSIDLRVPDERSLLLVGGDISLNGGRLNASGGRIALAGIAGDGAVKLNLEENNLRLSVPDNLALADISLTNQAFISSSGEGGGEIQVWGKAVTVSGGSQIESNTLGRLNGSGLTVNASESVQVIGESPTGIRSGLFTETFGSGNAGELTINTRQLQMLAGGKISAGTRSTGAAGNLTVNASELIKISGLTVSGNFGSDLYSQTNSNAKAKAGNLTINTRHLLVEDGGQVSVSTSGEGAGGELKINASESVQVIGIPDNPGKGATGIFAQSSGLGSPGKLTINTKDLLIQNGAGITIDNEGNGVGGSIIVNASESVHLIGVASFPQFPQFWFPSNISSDNFGSGLAGDITVNTKHLLIQDGALLSSNTYSSGAGGSLKINASESVQLMDTALKSNSLFPFPSALASDTYGVGNAGDITISTRQLLVKDRAQLSASTLAKGNAGSLIINATDNVVFNNDGTAFSRVESSASGKGGNINITTGSLLVNNGAQLSASTYGQGEAGNVIINASNTVSFNGRSSQPINGRIFRSAAYSLVRENASGKGGTIKINTGSLSVSNGAQLVASTQGQGDAGSVIIHATDTVSFDNGVALSDVGDAFGAGKDASGKGGSVNVTTGSLLVTNGGQLAASTFAKGDAGSVIIQARDTVSFDGKDSNGFPSAIFTKVGEQATGKGGSINIFTSSLFVNNEAELVTSTQGQGDAGNMIINATKGVSFNRGNALSEVEENAAGEGGSIDITTASFSVTNNAQLSASTLGEGEAGNIKVTADTFAATNGGQLLTATSSKFPAGNITVKVRDDITLSGADTGLFANTTAGSTGKGGSIFIDPETFTIRDGARVAVDSQGEGVGGNIELAAGFLTLDNGTISAETRSNTGGDIKVNLQDLLLLRNGSKISTTAGNQQFGGDGGNIAINSPFVVAVPRENSDITANAFTGKGGRVDITANGIFGILPQERPTQLSDITASSELGVSGQVTITTPDLDPSRGLAELPTNLVDASQQIASGCSPKERETAGRFIATGRGGLPLSPHEPLRGRAVITSWVNLPAATPVTQSTPQFVEAQDLIVDAHNNVILVAQSPQMSSAVTCAR